jgi:hypothetical protein
MLRYTKDIAILNANCSNWYIVIRSIWGSIDKDIYIALYIPLFNEMLDDFMLRIEEAQTFIIDIVKEQCKVALREKISSRDKAFG